MNRNFFRRTRPVHAMFNLGVPIYYYLLGRRLFGPAMKYPLLRLAHFPEWFLRGRLYLDFSGKQPVRYRLPENVPGPEHYVRPAVRELAVPTQAARFMKTVGPSKARGGSLKGIEHRVHGAPFSSNPGEVSAQRARRQRAEKHPAVAL